MDVCAPSVAVTAFLLNESLAVSGCVAGGSGYEIFQTEPEKSPARRQCSEDDLQGGGAAVLYRQPRPPHCALGALLAFSICAMRPMLQSGMLMSQPSSR